MINKKRFWILLTCTLLISVFSTSGCIDKQNTNNNNSNLDNNISDELKDIDNNSNNNTIKQNSSDSSLSLIMNLQEPPEEVIGG